MIDFNELILVAGDGRNVGKTTWCCRVIEKLSRFQSVTAVKISPHKHPLTQKQKILFQDEGITITEELDTKSTKDSSRYIQSGASKSLFVLVNDDKIEVLAQWLKNEIKGLIICESASLGFVVKPHYAFFVEGAQKKKKPTWEFSFTRITFINEQFEPDEGILFDSLVNSLGGRK